MQTNKISKLLGLLMGHGYRDYTKHSHNQFHHKLQLEPLEDRRMLSTIYSQTLSSNPGWTRSGQWDFGAPQGLGGGLYGNPDPTGGYTGSNVYGVNLYGNYNTTAGGPYYLTTSAINCSSYTNVNLNFRRWLNTDAQDYADAFVQVSNNGSNWNTIYLNTNGVVDNSWQLMQYNIGTYANNKATVYIRWGYQIYDGAYPLSGWNIDDVTLTGTLSGGDTTPPTVTGKNPASGSTITSSSANIDVTFSEPVQDVDA